jgi:phospholipase C
LLLPFHLDTSKTNAACTHDITHAWLPQHQSWNNGAMDGFVSSRLLINTNDATLTMGYYTRADLPFIIMPLATPSLSATTISAP